MGETDRKSDTLLAHSIGSLPASVSDLNDTTKLISKNKPAALNASKHKENCGYVTSSFLHNGTTGA